MMHVEIIERHPRMLRSIRIRLDLDCNLIAMRCRGWRRLEDLLAPPCAGRGKQHGESRNRQQDDCVSVFLHAFLPLLFICI